MKDFLKNQIKFSYLTNRTEIMSSKYLFNNRSTKLKRGVKIFYK